MSHSKEHWERLIGKEIFDWQLNLLNQYFEIIGSVLGADERIRRKPPVYLDPTLGKLLPGRINGRSIRSIWVDEFVGVQASWKPKQHSAAATSTTALLIHEQVFS